MIGIEVQKDLMKDASNLILTTTDGSNTFKVNHEIEKTEEFYTIVNAETFSKLVGKTTKEFIELENKDNYLQIKANKGTYKLDISINEDGEVRRFPEIKNIQLESKTINVEILKNQLKTAKSSIAKTFDVPFLTGYYVANNTITTNTQLICSIENNNFDETLLISNEMAELIQLIDEPFAGLLKENNDIILYTDTITISGKELEGKELYPVAQITDLLQKNAYQNTIKVNKQEILSVLDRMQLFVNDKYDKNGVKLAFTKEALLVKSQKSNAQELIDAECTSDSEFDILVDIEMLRNQIQTISTDIVEIQYGLPPKIQIVEGQEIEVDQNKSIKIVDGNCTHIIALLNKTE